MTIALTPEQEAFKSAYIRARGYWVAFNDGLLLHSPQWLEAYLAYADAPQREGPIEARLRELIYVAVDASTTHMFQQGLDIHIRMALAAGCAPGELIEVLQLATMQGLDSVVAGAEILAEEMADALPAGDAAAPLVARYESVAGEPAGWFAVVAALAPRYAGALVDLLETAGRHGTLSDHDRALVRLALASSPTHLNRPAMRAETRRARAAGATAAEILEVFQLVAHLGIHACVGGVPAVVAASGA